MIGNREQVRLLSNECNQLVAIFTRMDKTANEYLALQSPIRHPTAISQ